MAPEVKAHTTAAHPQKAASEKPQASLGLPVLVTSPVDLSRLIRELETIDESLLQLGLRQGGSEVKMPKTSQLMDKIIEQNKLNLLQADDRKQLESFFMSVKEKAPVLHMSFSADPSVSFLEKLVAWLRKEIHPLVLVTIGLQPNIGAGCVVRTINHQFDLSLRQDFAKKKDLLEAALSVPTEAKP